MGHYAFAVPVAPGKESLDREVMDEMLGARREDYEAALRDAGISRQTVWHQETPDGTLAIVYVEADSPESIGKFAASDALLPTWFREKMKEVHGIDISEPAPPVTEVHHIQL